MKETSKNAQEVASSAGIYASIQIAQAIQESGWGQSKLAKEAHNLFGIKGSYQGQTQSWVTKEDDGSGNQYTINANFRKYPSDKESYQDNADVIKSQPGTNSKVSRKTLKGEENKLYSCAWKKYASDYKQAAKCLEGSYATDTTYASTLTTLIETYNLSQFDTGSSGSSDDSESKDSKESTETQSKYFGANAWKNKMVNFQNNVYQSTFRGIQTGSTGFINNALVLGINNASNTAIKYAYVAMLYITSALILYMFFMIILYMVVLPNGLGGYKALELFEKGIGVSAYGDRKKTLPVLFGRLGLALILMTCLYANLIPMAISGIVSLIRLIIGVF